MRPGNGTRIDKQGDTSAHLNRIKKQGVSLNPGREIPQQAQIKNRKFDKFIIQRLLLSNFDAFL